MTMTHVAIENISERWIKEHVKRKDGVRIKAMGFPKVHLSKPEDVWKVTAVINWQQGFLGRHFESFRTGDTEVSLELNSNGEVVGHDLPKDFLHQNDDEKKE